jgi:putative ABC transport system ATP-binding protein
MRTLDLVGLAARISSLPGGLDTQLASSGSPLSIVEVMQLKLAMALLSAPRLLLLSQLYDMMPAEPLQAALSMLRAHGTTVLLFTGRPETLDLDCCYWLGTRAQHRFANRAALVQFLGGQEARS